MIKTGKPNKIYRGLIFFIGWILSPFTWWNDAFINIPLSYITANVLYYLTRLEFKWLLIATYWFTNFLGILFMYFGGNGVIIASRNRLRTVSFLAAIVIVYSTVMIYLSKHGRLLPLNAYLEKYCAGNFKWPKT